MSEPVIEGWPADNRSQVTRTVPALDVHRVAGHCHFSEHGLQPYWGLVNCYEPDQEDRHDGFDGLGDHWEISLSTHWTGRLADPSDRFDGCRYECKSQVVADDAVGDRDATLTLRPGFPRAEHVDTGELIQGMPTELPECLHVQVETTNLDIEEILPLLRAFFAAIRLNPGYVTAPQEWSRLYEFEGYLRVDRADSEAHLTGEGGILQQLVQFGSSDGDKGEYRWDHEEHQDHDEAVALDGDTWGDCSCLGRPMRSGSSPLTPST